MTITICVEKFHWLRIMLYVHVGAKYMLGYVSEHHNDYVMFTSALILIHCPLK